MLRRVLIGLSTLMILIVGVVGMKALKDMREPQQRQVLDNPGPVVRVVNIQPRGRAPFRSRIRHRAGETRLEHCLRSIGSDCRVVAAVAGRLARQGG